MKKIGVIGAGPAGLSAAYLLAKSQKFEVHLFEADETVGGMAKSISLWGQRVDLGPHRFFSYDKRVNELWLEAVGKEYRMINRLTRIYYNNTFFYYPLKAVNALVNLGIIKAILCLTSYLWYKVFPLQNEETFEPWVTNRFGKRLYQIFFKTYSEKLWGIPCTELDKDFAAQRIKKFTLFEAMKSAFIKKKTKHKTLADVFAYPLLGSGKAYENMAEKFVKFGGKLYLQKKIDHISSNTDGTLSLVIGDGSVERFDHVISTMPITTLVSKMRDVPDQVISACNRLRFRNTILVYLLVDKNELFPDQWLYIHAGEILAGRMTNFSNWTPELKQGKKETIVVLEYWCFHDDGIWRQDERELIELAKNDAVKTGLIAKEFIVSGKMVKVPRCYPVYDRGYQKNVDIVKSYLAGFPSLNVIGRYGSFKYNNQDHSILMGKLVADNLLFGMQHDLWAVNTDYEYQEATMITESGLVEK